MRLFRVIVLALTVLSVSVLAAQGGSCPALIEEALTTVQDACAEIGRNQACYGNIALEAIPRDEAPAFTFEQQGDLVNIADLQRLQLSSLDEVLGQWGIALMKLQANLPDALPGQNVTVLLFGDVEMTNAVEADDDSLTPMQAFTLRTGLGSAACEDAPADGILIQTPAGAGAVNLRANGVDIELGSTAYLTAQAGQFMTVSVMDGQGTVTADGVTVDVPAGMQTSIPLDDDLNADGEPSDPVPYDAAPLELLPIEVLPEAITIALPPGEGEGEGETAPPVTFNPMDPGSMMGFSPEFICPYLDQALAEIGMSYAEYLALIDQVMSMPQMTGVSVEGMQQFRDMIAACAG
jgi:hypothetical protein